MPSPPAPVYCPQACKRFCSSSCPEGCCEKTQQGLTRTTSSYTVTLPCPANCHTTSCHAKCPPQCCETAGKPRPLPLEDFYPNSAPMLSVRSKLACPTACYNFCSDLCPRQCCSKRNEKGTVKNQHRKLYVQGNVILE